MQQLHQPKGPAGIWHHRRGKVGMRDHLRAPRPLLSMLERIEEQGKSPADQVAVGGLGVRRYDCAGDNADSDGSQRGEQWTAGAFMKPRHGAPPADCTPLRQPVLSNAVPPFQFRTLKPARSNRAVAVVHFRTARSRLSIDTGSASRPAGHAPAQSTPIGSNLGPPRLPCHLPRSFGFPAVLVGAVRRGAPTRGRAKSSARPIARLHCGPCAGRSVSAYRVPESAQVRP
jgi:hypothetical protein